MSQETIFVATANLLNQVEFIEMHEAYRIERDTHHYLHMNPYYIDGHKTPYFPMLKTENLDDFFEKISGILRDSVSQKTINGVIQKYIQKQFPNGDEELLDTAEEITEHLWLYHTTPCIIYIPLQNIHIETSIEYVQLANSKICRGNNRSPLAEELKQLDERYKDNEVKPFFESNKPFPKSNFLLVETLGDEYVARQKAQIELKNSLMVLRFIAPMLTSYQQGQAKSFQNNFTRYNAARFVEPSQGISPYILQIHNLTHRPYKWLPLQEVKHYYLRQDRIDDAKEYFGLDALNYHFQKDNPISQRIIRALEFYDNGIMAWDTWEAVYRYAVAINVVLPKSKSRAKNIRPMLEALIKQGGYIGHMTENDDDITPTTHTWDELVEAVGDKFEIAYAQRGQILHSNDLITPTDEESEFSRTVAWNTIRLMAIQAKKENWITDAESKEWFEKVIKSFESEDDGGDIDIHSPSSD